MASKKKLKPSQPDITKVADFVPKLKRGEPISWMSKSGAVRQGTYKETVNHGKGDWGCRKVDGQTEPSMIRPAQVCRAQAEAPAEPPTKGDIKAAFKATKVPAKKAAPAPTAA